MGEMDDLLEIQRQANELNNLMFQYVQQSATGAERCAECGEFYLRPLWHACAPLPEPQHQ